MAGQAFGVTAVVRSSFLQIPVIALIGNDAGWTQISREQVPRLGSNVACGLAYTGEASRQGACRWPGLTGPVLCPVGRMFLYMAGCVLS